MLKKFTFLLAVLTLLSLVFYTAYLAIEKKSVFSKNEPEKSYFIYKEVDEKLLYGYIQEYRVSKNLTPYIEHPKLCEYASISSEEFMRIKGFTDSNAYHPTFIPNKDRWCKEIYCFKISENLSIVLPPNKIVDRGYLEKQVLEGWLNSKPHHDALLENYKYSCLKCYKFSCSQIFANIDE